MCIVLLLFSDLFEVMRIQEIQEFVFIKFLDMIACRSTIALPQERLHRRSPCRSRASPSPPRKAGKNNLYQIFLQVKSNHFSLFVMTKRKNYNYCKSF